MAVRVANSYSAIENPALLWAVTWQTSHPSLVFKQEIRRIHKQTVLNFDNSMRGRTKYLEIVPGSRGEVKHHKVTTGLHIV